MADFMLRFLLCNVFLCGIIGVLLLAKRLGRNHLSSRMQYRLWFLLPCLLTVPFLPFPIIGLPQLFSWLARQVHFSGAADKTVMKHTINLPSTGSSGWDQDFTLSVHGETSSFFGRFLLGLWITGMFVMLFLLIRSALRLQRLKASALPLQNRSVRRLYRSCLDEMQIHRDIFITRNGRFCGFLRILLIKSMTRYWDWKKASSSRMILLWPGTETTIPSPHGTPIKLWHPPCLPL